ncbi:MAG: hypothetical protein JWM13_890 [Arthrobacter sp.]|nr:hypothetical protein [Arthrobacter sp.]
MAMLHCTLVPAPGSTLPACPVELAVEVPEDCSGAELQEAISDRFGTGGLSVNGSPVQGLRVGDAPLRNGAVLVDGAVPGLGAAAPGLRAAPAQLFLAVHSGPGAGTIVPLGRGRFRIGRSGTDLVLPDAELSREHAQLNVTDSEVTLEDLHSANGTTVDGERVHRAVVTTGSLIRCGNSTMSLLFGGDSGASRVPDAAGRSVADPLPVANPAVGTASTSSRVAVLLMAALPLAIGVGLAVSTGLWMFLAFSLASAASLLIPALAGRKQRRALKATLDAALRADSERRRRSAPSAAELCADSTHAQQDSGPPVVESGAVWLRLGLAQQPANIRLEPADPDFRAPPLGLMPLTLDPAAAVTAVFGPQATVAGLVRSFLLQLAGYPAAHRTRVLVHGPPEVLPLAARFLPQVTLSCQVAGTAARLGAGPGPECDRGVLLVLDGADAQIPGPLPDVSLAASLSAAAVSRGWQVIHCVPQPVLSDADAVVLGGRTARLIHGHNEISFLPDLVPYEVFDSFCRRLGSAGSPHPDPPDAMTAVVALAGILSLGATEIARRWVESADTDGLPVPVGMGRNGSVHVDIERDGPHLLVAGTTGSGKSELLRTMVAGLAASYPPDRVSLLFVDFKGGSGLGPLTALPHCVGLLSDLGLQEVDRTLVSLRAEVRYREEVLASAQARDLIVYRSQDRALPALPHLVIVIDEFRMLVDEAPRALTELMRIAAIGRSLGIHLIMATQRPQGAITADIRANVTSRIALRVQSALESMDVLNSPLAADIPIATPGRAFLVKGTEPPQEFQTATLTPDRSPPQRRTVTVLTAAERLGIPPGQGSTEADQPARTQAREAATLAGVTRTLWATSGGLPPRRPVAGMLPTLLPFPSADSAGSPPAASPDPVASVRTGTVRLGWLDMPEQQRLAELIWRPEDHGHLALVGGVAGPGAGGGDGGGVEAALALVVNQFLTAEQESHLYILDAAGSFSRTAAAPRVGAVAGAHEVRRAVRVLERLTGEMIRRLSAPGISRPRVVLVLCGWGTWVSAFRSGPLARGEDLVQDIVRDGARAGIAVLISGERELTTSRFFGGIANRIFFPAGSSDEDRLAWPRLPALEVLPGRVAVLGTFLGMTSAAAHVGQLYMVPSHGLPTHPRTAAQPAPFRVEALPQRVSVSQVLAAIGGPAVLAYQGADPPAGPPAEAREGASPGAPGRRPPVRLCFGVGGDELGPVSLTLPAGSVLAALGGPRSGKTGLLAALPALNSPAGGWLRPAAGTDPAEYWAALQARSRAGTLNPEAVLLADDIDLLSEDSNRQLLGLNSLGWTVVLTAGFSPALQHRVPLVQCARHHGTGILICPRSLLDGDLFGVRFELEASPPPGRAVLISDGQGLAVQLADPAVGSAAEDAAK